MSCVPARPEVTATASPIWNDSVNLFARANLFASRPGREKIPNQIDTLTPLERNVLSELLTGRTNKEIALRLQLSPFTVREYVQRIARKLNCRNRVAIASYCAGASLHQQGFAVFAEASTSSSANE